MKKFFSLILIGILGVMVFASCDKNTEKKKNEPVKAMTVEDYLAKVDTGDYKVEMQYINNEGKLAQIMEETVINKERLVQSTKYPDGRIFNITYIKPVANGTYDSFYKTEDDNKYQFRNSTYEEIKYSLDGFNLKEHISVTGDCKNATVTNGECHIKWLKGDSDFVISKEGIVRYENRMSEKVLLKVTIKPGKVAIKYPTADEIA